VLLLFEGNLPILVTQGEQVAVVAPVEEFFPWGFFDLALKKGIML